MREKEEAEKAIEARRKGCAPRPNGRGLIISSSFPCPLSTPYGSTTSRSRKTLWLEPTISRRRRTALTRMHGANTAFARRWRNFVGGTASLITPRRML